MKVSTVKTLYNAIGYNKIFNIRHKIAGNGSVSIKIPSSQQNIHLTTPTVTSGNRYTIYIENIFIITELLPCVRQFCYQNKVFWLILHAPSPEIRLQVAYIYTDTPCAYEVTAHLLHEQVSVSLDKWEALCILMQYEIELMYKFGIIAFSFIFIHLYNIFFYQRVIMLKSGNGQNFFITAHLL